MVPSDLKGQQGLAGILLSTLASSVSQAVFSGSAELRPFTVPDYPLLCPQKVHEAPSLPGKGQEGVSPSREETPQNEEPSALSLPMAVFLDSFPLSSSSLPSCLSLLQHHKQPGFQYILLPRRPSCPELH